MTREEIIRLIVGTGLLTAIIQMVRATWTERGRREIAYLQNQVTSLYGPLHFYTSLNKQFFELADRFHAAYGAEYAGRRWSQEQATQEALERDTAATLGIANGYIRQVERNNEEILRILQQNWSLVEPDDQPIFEQFRVDYARMRAEAGEQGVRTPFLIYRRVGDISFMRQEFIQHIERKFEAKRLRLNTLLRIRIEPPRVAPPA